MTNEEFEGHLMAALHGPNSDQILSLILEKASHGIRRLVHSELVGEDMKIIVNEIGNMIGDLRGDVCCLQTYTHAREMEYLAKRKKLDAKDTLDLVVSTTAVKAGCAKSMRESINSNLVKSNVDPVNSRLEGICLEIAKGEIPSCLRESKEEKDGN